MTTFGAILLASIVIAPPIVAALLMIATDRWIWRRQRQRKAGAPETYLGERQSTRRHYHVEVHP
jgi:hypothetical protein